MRTGRQDGGRGHSGPAYRHGGRRGRRTNGQIDATGIRVVAAGATVYTSDHGSYERMPNRDHEGVRYTVGEYVRGMENLLSMLERAHKGTFHKVSTKHRHRYAAEFARRHSVCSADSAHQMRALVARMAGRRLTYRALIAVTGMPAGARSAQSMVVLSFISSAS